MHVLVFQHIAAEPPAAFAHHMDRSGDTFDVVRFFAGDAIPDFNGYDALLVMGGPMDVWDTEQYPWLTDEIAAIRKWVRQMQRPYLGICLGHQLLAQAAGGECAKMDKPEIGFRTVSLSQDGQKDDLLHVFAPHTKVVQWHGVEVTEYPSDAVILADNPACRCQALRVGGTAWGVQFHPEVLSGTLQAWMSDPANLQCARDWMENDTGTDAFILETKENADILSEQSAALWNAFRRVASDIGT